MNIRPIKTDSDYDAALRRIADLMDAKPGTPETDELDVLASLVEQYEAKRFPIDVPSPTDAIVFEWSRPTSRDVILCHLLEVAPGCWCQRCYQASGH